MKIYQIYTNSALRNFTYILASESAAKVYCIDPYDADQVLDFLLEKSWQLTGIINTHEHFDHTMGNNALKKATGCEIWAHENAKGKIKSVDHFLTAQDRLPMEKDYLEVMDTPGHTFAHLCLKAVVNEEVLAVFTGDTLFNAGVGNCHNGGDPEILYKTISEQFYVMDDGVKIYPGHEYLGNNLEFTLDREPDNKDAKELLSVWKKSKLNGDYLVNTMGVEKKVNTFFRLNNPAIKAGLKNKFKLFENNDLSEKETFLKLRELRNRW